MIWTIFSDDSNLQIETNFADGVFKQEKPTLRVTSKRNLDVLLLIDGTLVASYIPDADKVVFIDLTDYFSTINIGGGGVGVIQLATPVTSRVSLVYDVKGLRNPQYMEIPPAIGGQLSNELSIAPPARWLVPLFGLNDRVELYRFSDSENVVRFSLSSLSGRSTDLTPQDLYSIDVPSVVHFTFVSLLLGNILIERKRYYRQPLLCNRHYAAVEWVGRTGMVKRHTWEVRDIKDKVMDKVELMTRFNGYREAKGYETTIVLHLDNLTQYDYWYYSDIITSNDVRVALNEVDADFGEETRVRVLSSSNSQPNASGAYELNVEINFRRYGRV